MSSASFAADTAAKTGKSRRTVERAVEIGQKLGEKTAGRRARGSVGRPQPRGSGLRGHGTTAAQRADLGSSLLRFERVKARERQEEGRKAGGKEARGGKGKLLVDGDHPQAEPKKDRAAERVARQIGVNRQTVERVEGYGVNL
jgi:hypothetical protein